MRTSLITVFALSTALAVPARAQYVAGSTVQATAPADQLASVMRRLATAPTDTFALISAGELSVKLDDMSAAAAFFARADKIDPRNGRVKAGIASILVRAERPGEALRYFQMAEKLGLPSSRFAADRGLAFDLLGEQERAQRDYRLALRTAADHETVRRYALSLAISGNQASALAQLEPLVRRQDRAAWRVRAFVLAMNGDLAGANKIATTMMPTGMAGGLRPFFERLSMLAPTDRAFAVHFGEVRPTPARLADARMKPLLPVLGPDPYPPVRLAVVQRPAPPPVVVQDRKRGRDNRGRNNRGRDRRERVPVALATRSPLRSPVTSATRTVLASAGPAPRPAPAVSATRLARTLAGASTESVTQASLTAQPVPRPAIGPPVQVASVAPNSLPRTPAATSSIVTSAAPLRPSPGPAVASTGSAFLPSPTTRVLVPVPALIDPTPGQAPVLANTARVAGPLVGTSNASISSTSPAGVQPAPGFSSFDDGALATAAPVPAVRSEDSILARIVGSITIPGEELGIATPARKAAAVVPLDAATRRTLAVGTVKAAIETADRADAARTITAAAKARPVRANAPATRGAKVELASRTGARAKTGAAGDAKLALKLRTAAERREADRKKAADEKVALAKQDKGGPERIWVQVAGGASEGDLPRAWSAAQKKAAALKGRQAYTTPLRATNRVVTGPFKTEAEARALVNQLARQGVSAFQFISVAGQKMTKLSSK